MSTQRPHFLDDMHARGQIQQATDEPGLRSHLADPVNHPRRAYVGFDPTASSLTVGNLVPAIALVRFQRAGHIPYVLMGGGTGLIGDPSGKTAERQLRTRDEVEANVKSIMRIFEPLLDFSATAPNRARLVNNIDWLEKLSYLDALRDVGKYFSVNMMIQKESVRERLHNRDQGISYTEFSYMILQAYDYQHLWEKEGVTIQMGGSDQFGNIVCGIDLVDRLHTAMTTRAADLKALSESPTAIGLERDEAARVLAELKPWFDAHEPVHRFGLTWPLVTKSDGGKFGKTESGAVWLTADRTSPYAFYQFWLNSADDDVVKFLKTYTLIEMDEINALAAAHAANPGERAAHRALARHMTELLHGPTEREGAEAAARALFSGEVATLPESTLREALSSVPGTEHDKTQLSAGVPLLDLLVTTKLAQSKREAKEFLTGGSVLVNGRKAGPDDTLTTADLLHGSMIALRRGKKNWHLTTWM